MKTRIPDTFSVSDSVREYCGRKWGHPKLADVFLTDFIECFQDNGRRHDNWDTTFKTYLRRNSPEGPFYNRDYWERKLQAAKSLEYGDRRRRQPDYHPKQIEHVTPPARASEMMRALIAKIQ